MFKLSEFNFLSTSCQFLAIIFIAIGGLVVWDFLAYFINVLQRANPSIAAIIMGVITTTIVVISGVLISILTIKAQKKRQEIEDEQHQRKIEIYQPFLEVIARLTSDRNPYISTNPPMTRKELNEFMVRFKKDIVLWGSPSVIKAQIVFEAAINSEVSVFLAADKLYLAIRSDIGLSNKGLTKHQLIHMYLKDIRLPID